MEFGKSLSPLHHFYLLPNFSSQPCTTSRSSVKCRSPEVYQRTGVASGHLVSWGDFLQDRYLCQLGLGTLRLCSRKVCLRAAVLVESSNYLPKPLSCSLGKWGSEGHKQSPEQIPRPEPLPPGHLLSCFIHALTNHTSRQSLGPQMFTRPLLWVSTDLGSPKGAGIRAGAEFIY